MRLHVTHCTYLQLSIESIRFFVVNFASLDSIASKLLAVGVDIDSTGFSRFDTHDVDIEDERHVGLCFEPMHVIFGIRNGRTTS